MAPAASRKHGADKPGRQALRSGVGSGGQLNLREVSQVGLGVAPGAAVKAMRTGAGRGQKVRCKARRSPTGFGGVSERGFRMN